MERLEDDGFVLHGELVCMLLLLDRRRERKEVDGTNENPSAEGAKRRRVTAARIMVIAYEVMIGCRVGGGREMLVERTSRCVGSSRIARDG